MTDIAQGTTDGDFSAFAGGINNQGEVVGTYDAGQYFLHIWYGYPHGFVSLNGVRTDLGTLAGENDNLSYGYGINDAGQVVGVSTNTTIPMNIPAC
jgi:probable HAF family extracellular repeat protein